MSAKKGYRCRVCPGRTPEFAWSCPACGSAGTLVPVDWVRPRAERERVVPSLEEAEALEGDRIDTGIPGLNRVLGTNRNDPRTGLHLPSSILLGGGPGCGKTTLLLQMLARVKTTSVLLISAEQTLSEIKASLVGIGLGAFAPKILAYSLLEDEGNVNVAMEKIQILNPRVLVVDSLSELKDPLTDTGDVSANQARLVQLFKRDAETHKRATILISHLNKEDDLSGARKNPYKVSTVMIMAVVGKRRRQLSCAKNRFGDTTEIAHFDMGPKGLIEVSQIQAEEDKREEKKKREEEKREDRQG